MRLIHAMFAAAVTWLAWPTTGCATHDLLIGDDTLPSTIADASDEGVVAQPSSGDGGDGGAEAAALPQCSQADRDAAQLAFDDALKAASERVNGWECGDPVPVDPTLLTIAEDLQAAVDTCHELALVIANSANAAPIRETLKGNLVLAAFDGRLEVRDSQGKLVMKGLAQVLNAGVTVWGPSPGAFGHESTIAFKSGNQAVHSRMNKLVDPPEWNDTAITYTVGSTTLAGAAIVITEGGVSTTYRLIPGDPEPYDLQLVPEDPANEEKFWAIPGECGG